jgi:hypothetical protein
MKSPDKVIKQLLPKYIKDAFEKQGYVGDKKISEIKVVCKFFNPIGAGTWWLYEKIDEDIYMCFALLSEPMFAELGTISISELANLKLPLGLHIERDIHFEPFSKTLQEVIDNVQKTKH